MSWADLPESTEAYVRSAPAKFAPYASVFTECVSPVIGEIQSDVASVGLDRSEMSLVVMSSQRSSELQAEVNVAKGYSPVSANTGSNTPMPCAASEMMRTTLGSPSSFSSVVSPSGMMQPTVIEGSPWTPGVQPCSTSVCHSPSVARAVPLGLSSEQKCNVDKATLTPTKADVIAFGGIAQGMVAGVRSSDRLRAQPFSDATQLDRAIMIAQRRDDFSGQGTNLNKKSSLLSFTEKQIVHRASRIGVSLGEDEY
jgi:hypothetical protein